MISGLTTAQVEEKKRLGKINTSTKNSTKFIEILINNIFSPFNILFFIVIFILIIFYFRTSESKLLLDGFGVASLVIINTVISLVQEIRSKIMLDRVELLIKKDIQVLRDNNLQRILVEDLVEGDVVYIERGDQIPADGKIIKNTRIEIDESLLSGESEPLLKMEGDNILSGSFVVAGNAYFIAQKLGKDSYAGKITNYAKNLKYIVSPLQKRIFQIIQILSVTAIILIILKAFDNSTLGIFEVEAIRQYTTIIVSLVPQGLIFLSTITYIVGIYRISKLGGIVQKMNAVEAFSGINVVCMDKTGTLTKNKLSVTHIVNLSQMDETELELYLGTYAKASQYKNSTLNALNKFGNFEDFEILDEIPFNSVNKYSAVKIRLKNDIKIFLLGSYETLKEHLNNLNNEIKIDEEKIKNFRNILLFEIENIDIDLKKVVESVNYKPLALVSLLDTVRPDSKYALNLFREKNIELKILSGDAVSAIQAIAQKLGWIIEDKITITGPDLKNLNKKDFDNAVMDKKIFARLAPEQKKLIVDALRSKGLYTAMIGDGVNDLPAIKSANLGIAMEEGSQVTKEVADIILIKNKFSLLPEIFDEGNKIINSVSMGSKLFLSKNFLIAIVTVLSVLLNFPFIFTPRKVSFLTIFIITLPAFLISIHNKDVSSNKNFVKDLISTVSVSTIISVIFAYSSFFISNIYFPEASEDIKSQIFICIIVLLSVANFLCVTTNKITDKNSKNLYIFYSFCLIYLLFICTISNLKNTPLAWFGDLYEISQLNFNHWYFILIFGISGGIILYIFQRFRQFLLDK